jgi:RND family efflux transporter MFP subunit
VSVSVAPAQQRDLPIMLRATGSVTAVSNIDVRPQTTSAITQVHIREGQFVKAGDLLFTLDARADLANLAKAQAQLRRDEAALADAQRQLGRSRDLLEQHFVSQGVVDTNQATVASQTALVAADHAAIDAERVALSYAEIRAPSAGRIGAISGFVGSTVQANQTSLAMITQLDPIDVSFSLPQRYLSDALSALKNSGAKVTATLQNDPNTVLEGRLQFVDNLVDAASGTVKVKARFSNADQRLWPGAFVNVALTVRTLTSVTVIPQEAIIQNARGPIVYVADNGKATLRPIKVLQTEGSDAAIEGVKAGETIILEGRQNLRPGQAIHIRAEQP